MAGGKLTPRQKMINLMYLIFIAMLALNMSKEVLSAFGILNSKILESNQITDNRNEISFNQLSQKAKDQPGKYEDKKIKVEKIRQVSREFNDYIEKLKLSSISEFDKNNLPYEQMDKGEFFDNLFFDNDKLSKEGQEFLDKLKDYTKQIKEIGGSSIAESELKKIQLRFSTEPVYSKKAGVKLPWLDYNYKGFPLIASVTKLSQLQADIKNTESDIMNGMFQSDLIADASLTGYVPIVVLDKSVYFQGEAVTGKVVLGKYDPKLIAKSVVLNGSQLQAQSGQAPFSFGSGAVGDHKINGFFNFDENGSVVKLPIIGNYTVVHKPNSANISADKMNVVYRGLANPITITFAGIPDNKVSASAPGLVKGSKPGEYMLTPGVGNEVTVNVTGKLPSGQVVTDKKVFRIKATPSPAGAISGIVGSQKGSKTRLNFSQVTASLGGFLWDLKYNVISFSVKVPGQPMVFVQGDWLDDSCKRVIEKANKGDKVIISDIKTKMVGSAVRGEAYSVMYEIQ